MKTIYRIRVEQHPMEGHKRYFPEMVVLSDDKNREDKNLKWKNTEHPAVGYCHEESGAKSKIDERIAYEEEESKDYTENIIYYP